jgi:hypothetical protein
MAREKLERGLAELAGRDNADAAMWAHFIGHLIGFDFSASPHLQGILGDARQIRDRAFYYAAQFFARVARDNPVAVLLEDIHWADSDSLDLIQHLLHSQPNLPLLVIGLTRPTLFEQRPNWGEGTMAHLRLDLVPLSDDDNRRLVAEILRKVPNVPSALVDLIVTRAEGSPFYTEELIKMLIEDGVIVTHEETWRVELERLAEVRIPATLTGILQARLDGCRRSVRPATGRHRGAYLLGQCGQHASTRRATNCTGDSDEWKDSTGGKELIFRHEDRCSPTREYIFKHAILRSDVRAC